MAHTSPAAPDQHPESTSKPDLFPDTRWSLVVKLEHSEDVVSLQALGDLLRIYWRPLFVFALRSGCSQQDAEDAVQEFCAQLIRQRSLQRADPTIGRLRAFLLTSFRNTLRGRHRDSQREKRGGGQGIFSLEEMEGAGQLVISQEDSPDEAFERQWALTLVAATLLKLKGEYISRDRELVFTLLEPALAWNGSDVSYHDIAQTLHTSVSAVQQQVKRMRVRFRALLEKEINETVSNEKDAVSEREYLIQVLSKK